MAHCEWIKLPDGGTVLVRRSGPRRKRCSVPGCDGWGDYLCDGPSSTVKSKSRTCDRPLCAKHRVHREPNWDFCLEHSLAPEAEEKSDVH